MSTGVIILLIVIVAVVLAVAAMLVVRSRSHEGGRGLKRRFGPEYDRAVAHHDGDTKAAERELAERVKTYGSLELRPLEAAERERFAARWTAAQERFVDAPREAVVEADRLIGEVAAARGFPEGGSYADQLSALSVHHARTVHGYRRVHRVAHPPMDAAAEARADATGAADPSGTEDLREAMVEARALFEDLMAPDRRGDGAARREHAGHGAGRRESAAPDRGRSRAPWDGALNRRHVKGS
ncbi:hypothetical protein [Streptomyces minutiscleroticus]|uniref:Secreted protein n=1 Tax=Streptomyces minutiscleroticus TaxID=68238 RepID=A0A918NA28_9ACTN|nr:hypothetical protein [Streptomyces minutiscleroticus]GGX52405.1 hypothetical protein GCM10010358_02610 [Streptomyces minutiscleroticus]